MAPLPLSEFPPLESELTGLLRSLVEIESPTPDKAGVDRAGNWAAGQMAELGASLQQFPQQNSGDHWLGVWGDGPGGILMLTHLDTVHPIGTLERFPWREAGERCYGPGILDMKASLAMALIALRALRDHGRLPDRRISLLATSDEETGSHSSVELIREQARRHDLVLCLEPALPDGALKTWRKGTGLFELEVRGRPAHAGANPEDGINAIHEMAALVQQLVAAADAARGTTIGVGTIRGGTRTNVVPASCRAKVDVRVLTEEEQQRVSAAIDALGLLHPEAVLIVHGEWNRPPMPRTPQMAATFAQAREIGARLGLSLTEGGTGGGSDANFVAPLGIPVLDGLGAVGGGAHTEEEFVLRRSLVERSALLAALLGEWPLDRSGSTR
jgi:glutamate carboxypeptidase